MPTEYDYDRECNDIDKTFIIPKKFLGMYWTENNSGYPVVFFELKHCLCQNQCCLELTKFFYL